MIKMLYTLGALSLIGCAGTQQQAPAPPQAAEDLSVTYAKTITEEELKELLYTYASDEFMGRETGTPGEKKATDFLQNHYKTLKIEAGQPNGQYLQKVALEVSEPSTGTLTAGDRSFEVGEDLLMASGPVSGNFDVVYAGYGIAEPDYNDYAKLDVKDKIVLVKIGQPDGLAAPSTDWSSLNASFESRITAAVQAGAKGIMLADQEAFERNKRRFQAMKERQSSGQMRLVSDEESMPVILVSNSLADALAPGFMKNEEQAGHSTAVVLNIKASTKPVDANNVVAFIPGRTKPNEFVIISAHLDHVGTNASGEVYNGADDDGSGTVAVMEIAEAFKKAQEEGNGPERSVVFLHVTGEEKGLFGSEYYTDHPVFPLENTVVDLNIDMIGRIDPKREGSRNYVYLIGSDKLSTELHELSEAINEKYMKMEFDYKYNDDNDPNRFYYRSDHYNFAKNNIPVIFYFNGTHDDYHKVTDTPDKINYDLLALRAQLVFHTAWEIANRPAKPVVDKAGTP